jgi:hypothetical protein
LDTFTNGGQLVDLSTWYAGRDKVQHVVCGLLLARVLHHLAPWPVVFLLVFLLAVAWELFERHRYEAWVKLVRGHHYVDAPPFPKFADNFSWRDVVAGLAGALLAVPL